jgi:hypothetical protein
MAPVKDGQGASAPRTLLATQLTPIQRMMQPQQNLLQCFDQSPPKHLTRGVRQDIRPVLRDVGPDRVVDVSAKIRRQ